MADEQSRKIRFTIWLLLLLAGRLCSAEPNESKPMKPDFAIAAPGRCDHKHPAFGQRVEQRLAMVAEIKANDINEPNVLMALQIAPRHFFVPADKQPYAYIDLALPIGREQTISQPYIVAFMIEALQLAPDSKVLEIGTGSGYQAAVCAEIAAEVYTIEIIKDLAQTAEARLKELGYKNVFVKVGDGFFGWAEKGPFDAIIGTAAADKIPPPLIEQLKPAGRLILPYENEAGLQNLVVVTKDPNGSIHKQTVLPVRFVPMTGKVREKESKK